MNPHNYSNNDSDSDEHGNHDGNDDQQYQQYQQQQQQQQQPQAAIEEWSVERLSRAGYKELGRPENVEIRFRKHLLASPSCRNSLRILLLSSSTTSRDYSLEIDAFDLLEADPVLGHLLLKFPGTLSGVLEKAIVSAQKELERQILEERGSDNPQDKTNRNPNNANENNNINKVNPMGPMGDNAANNPVVKGHNGTRVHARLIHLPPTCCKMSLSTLQATDVGKIVQCVGTVVRVTPVCMYESCRTFKCKGKQGCGAEFYVHADLQQRHNALMAPERCQGSITSNCKGQNFQALENNGSVHTDYQEVTIQEAASQLGGAHVPRSLLVKLEHDLVDRCQPGDEVVIVGVLLSQWHQSVMVNVDSPVGMALHAHSIRVVQDKSSSAWASSGSGDGQSLGADIDGDKYRAEFHAFWADPKSIAAPMAARDYICRAVCSKLYGMAVVKLGLLITLIGGGCRHDGKTKSLGDEKGNSPLDDDEPEPFQMIQNKPAALPSMHYGEARSQTKDWKEFGASVQTRRRGQSHLLLVGDPGTGKSQFLRFAAAICPRSVLTTGVGTTSAGLTCAAVRENGKEFSLEAGALVLADQGVCCIDEFGCIQDQDRTTIHEAMEQQTLSVAKAGIVCKLNCRATIIAVMNPRDCLYDNDASLSRNTGLGTPLLSRFDIIFKMMDSSDAERDSNVTTYLLNRAIQGAGLDTATEKDPMDNPWTMEKLRAYISYVREKFQPAMTDDAANILEAHYEKCRSAQSTTIPVTVRFLESLIRLSQAHARLMFRNEVTLDDAVAVIRVMECTAFASSGFSPNSDDFSNDSLYCDPMTIDFSFQADLDFLCFKARILERYGMQNRLTPDQSRQVSDTLGQTYCNPHETGNTFNSSPGGSNGWSGLERGGDYYSHHNPKRRRQM